MLTIILYLVDERIKVNGLIWDSHCFTDYPTLSVLESARWKGLPLSWGERVKSRL
jgi:hypothetical protein